MTEVYKALAPEIRLDAGEGPFMVMSMSPARTHWGATRWPPLIWLGITPTR